VLEHTLAGYPEQQRILEEVLASPLIPASELPPVPNYMRKPPSAKTGVGGLFQLEQED
jgi:hypothetical protein